MLTPWNKLAAVGSVASILGLSFYLFSPAEQDSHRNVVLTKEGAAIAYVENLTVNYSVPAEHLNVVLQQVQRDFLDLHVQKCQEELAELRKTVDVLVAAKELPSDTSVEVSDVNAIIDTISGVAAIIETISERADDASPEEIRALQEQLRSAVLERQAFIDAINRVMKEALDRRMNAVRRIE